MGIKLGDEELANRNANHDDDDAALESPTAAIATLNQCLGILGESPIQARKRERSRRYSARKLLKIQDTIEKNLNVDAETHKGVLEEILAQLKTRFTLCETRSQQIQVLTVLPQSWTIRRIQDEFGVTNHMARHAKELAELHGAFASPNPRSGRKLSQTVSDLVQQFYLSDEVSRQLPGKKYYVTIKSVGGKILEQKRLILCNLKEAFKLFKDTHVGVDVGFSKFAELRPKQAAFPGASGTHSVCVCTIHQNTKLMFEGVGFTVLSGLKSFLNIAQDVDASYRHFLAMCCCNPARPLCYLGECDMCPELGSVVQCIIEILEAVDIDEVTFKLWVSVDRTRLETKVCDIDEFMTIFCGQLQRLKRHDFIATQQSNYVQHIKRNLAAGELLVMGDFAENYAFVVQDAVQGYHWTNDQCTIHPFVVYYYSEVQCRVEVISFAVISDCLVHGTVAVHCFIRELLAYIKTITAVSKVMYFTDGAASQYKNKKNFINLCFHEQDFGMPAEWHFFATSHGKGPCDVVGGTLKRLAARASLQKVGNSLIQIPREFYLWAVENVPNVKSVFVAESAIAEEEDQLQSRFETAVTIVGTQQFHAFIPIAGSTTHLHAKIYSSEDELVKCRVSSLLEAAHDDDTPVPVEAGSYYTCKYDNRWWLGFALDVMQETGELRMTFLNPAGPASSFYYPSRADILLIGMHDVILRVEPTTATGRVYKLSEHDTERSNGLILKARQQSTQ